MSTTRRARCRCSRCRRSSAATTPTFALADGRLRPRPRARRRLAARRRGLVRRRVAAPRRLADPVPLRPLARAARDRRARGSRHRPRPARLGAARRGRRREGLAAGAGAARARLGVAAAAPAGRAGSAPLVLGLAVVPFAIVAPARPLGERLRPGSRPLQIESLGARLLTSFAHPAVVTSHGSQNIVGHGALAACFAVLQVVALVALWVAFARGPATPQRLLRFAAAAVCAFIVFGKVLSPQYLIWLVPLVPLVRGRRGAAAAGLLVGGARPHAGVVPDAVLALRPRLQARGRRARTRPRAGGAARRAGAARPRRADGAP